MSFPTISPIATEENSGPSYDTDFVLSVRNDLPVVTNLIGISPNPATNHIVISFENGIYNSATLEIVNAKGTLLQTIARDINTANQNHINYQLDSLPSGLYMIRATSHGNNNAVKALQSLRFVKH